MDYSRFLRKRLRNVGLNSRDARFVGYYFQKQVSARGLVNATAYFKAVGDQIINKISGSSERTPWVKTYCGFPKKFYFLSGYPIPTVLRVAKLARSVVFPALTRTQVKKFISAVTSSYTGTEEGLREIIRLQNLGVSHFGLINFTNEVDIRYPEITRIFHRMVSRSGPTPYSEPPVLESLGLIRGSIFEKLPRFEEAFEPLNLMPIRRYVPKDVDTTFVGEIAVTQENGGKARFYGQLPAIYQSYLTPIYQHVASVRNQFRSDCTLNQESGAVWAQQQLLKGKTLMSADARNATDRFPWLAQLSMLHQIGVPQNFIDVFTYIAKGRWKVLDDLVGPLSHSEIKWEVGQPLGTRPSIAIYGLCHNAFLRAIAVEHGLDPDESFRILGDDVVMLADLWPAYRDVCLGVGVEFALEKSHYSNRFAEFAGYSITPECMVRPGRFKAATIKNHISLVKDLKRVLTGESYGDFLTIQQAVLFRQHLDRVPRGKFISPEKLAALVPKAHETYTPPTRIWSKFLRISTELDRTLSLPRYQRARLFGDGLLEYMKRVTGANQNNLVKPFKEDILAPIRPLPDSATKWGFMQSSRDFASHIEGTKEALDRSLVNAWCVVQNMFYLEEATYSECLDILKKTSDAYHRELWLPPLAKTMSVTTYHCRLLGAITRANFV